MEVQIPLESGWVGGGVQKCRPRFSDLKPYSGSARGSVFLTPKLSLSSDRLSNEDPRFDLRFPQGLRQVLSFPFSGLSLLTLLPAWTP